MAPPFNQIYMKPLISATQTQNLIVVMKFQDANTQYMADVLNRLSSIYNNIGTSVAFDLSIS